MFDSADFAKSPPNQGVYPMIPNTNFRFRNPIWRKLFPQVKNSNKKEEKIIKISHKDLMNFRMIWPHLISKQWRLWNCLEQATPSVPSIGRTSRARDLSHHSPLPVAVTARAEHGTTLFQVQFTFLDFILNPSSSKQLSWKGKETGSKEEKGKEQQNRQKHFGLQRSRSVQVTRPMGSE